MNVTGCLQNRGYFLYIFMLVIVLPGKDDTANPSIRRVNYLQYNGREGGYGAAIREHTAENFEKEKYYNYKM